MGEQSTVLSGDYGLHDRDWKRLEVPYNLQVFGLMYYTANLDVVTDTMFFVATYL